MAIEDNFKQAIAAYDSGQFDAAEEALSRFKVVHGGYDGSAWAYLAMIAARRGQGERAVAHARQATRNLRDADLLFKLAERLLEVMQAQAAEAALHKAIALDPKFTDAYILLGMALQQQGKADEAKRAFELAIVNDHRAIVARYYLALLCIESGDQKRALSQLHFVLRLQPDYTPARMLQADLYQRLGDHRQALVELCQIHTMGVRESALYEKMARSFMAIGDRAQGLLAYERAYGVDRGLFAAGWQAAQMREEQGHWEKALAIYRTLLASPEHRQQAEEAIARLERTMAQYDLKDRADSALVGEFTFRAPPVQARPATDPFGGTGRFNTHELASRRPTRTAPIAPPMELTSQPDPLDGFLRGMADFVRQYVPEETLETLEVLKLRSQPASLDDFLKGMADFVKQHVPKETLDVLKRRISGK